MIYCPFNVCVFLALIYRLRCRWRCAMTNLDVPHLLADHPAIVWSGSMHFSWWKICGPPQKCGRRPTGRPCRAGQLEHVYMYAKHLRRRQASFAAVTTPGEGGNGWLVNCWKKAMSISSYCRAYIGYDRFFAVSCLVKNLRCEESEILLLKNVGIFTKNLTKVFIKNTRDPGDENALNAGHLDENWTCFN